MTSTSFPWKVGNPETNNKWTELI